MSIDPNIDDMTAHLALLFDWTQTDYPNALFEVRCIHPKGGKCPNERFACTPDGYERATKYAVQHNDQGYNIYTTVNPLRPGTDHAATDEDVEIAIHQFVDGDGVASEQVIERSGFQPTFATTTGTIPAPRAHIYWRQSEPIIDMIAWSNTQSGLAQHLGTDTTVKNPSRVDRLAGTVSYPPKHKQARGYVTEVTALDRTGNGDVCKDSFAASFPYSEPKAEMPPKIVRDPMQDTSGKVPIKVIEAAFDAIPALMGDDNRDTWLDISQCARDANPNSFAEFDTWQRASDRYDPKKNSWDWPLKATPRQGSYLGLFAYAKAGDEKWWSHDPDVYEWWIGQQAKRAALEHPTFGDDGDPNEAPTIKVAKQSEPTPAKDAVPPIFEPFTPTNIADIDFAKLPNRRWVYGRRLLRGYVSAWCGDGGVGKTSLVVGTALSIARGKSVFLLDDDIIETAHKVHVQGPVMIWTFEDNEEELILRLAGELELRGIDPRSLRDMVYIASGRDHPFCAASLDKAGRVVKHDISPAIEQAKQLGLVACFFDPFVNSHGLDGNKNDHIAAVLDQYRQIAYEADIAAHINHHFKKGGQAGDAMSSLGAVSFTSACRSVETLTFMNEKEAQSFGVDEYKRTYYVKLSSAKANLSARNFDGEWYQYRSVKLNNASEEYPDGDEIGVLVRWQPQNSLYTYTWAQIARVLDRIDAGCDDNEYFTTDRKSKRWVGHLIMAELAMTEDKAKLLIKDWCGFASKGRKLPTTQPVLRRDLKYVSKERSNQQAMKLQANLSGRDELESLMVSQVTT